MLMTVRQALRMESNELFFQLKAGKTIAENAEGQGITISVVEEELLAPVRERLDRAVADGKLNHGERSKGLAT